MKRKLYTVGIFVKVNTKRFFRDRTAIFFTVAFPLIFLVIFGGLFGKNTGVSFKVAVINDSHTPVAKQFTDSMHKQTKLFKIDDTIKSLSAANEKMGRGELDAAIEIPGDFGMIPKAQKLPSGQVVIHFTQNNEQAAQTLQSVLQAQLANMNAKLVTTQTPFTVTSKQTNERSLSTFDYTFSGLLGFSIIGLGIFGPINVFPELKKQGILRRLHTTPIRVWQYFLATMASQAIIGLITMVVMFAFAIKFFDLKVVGNYFGLAAFLVLGIVTILGIGLAIGGWAKNERQAAPLANLVTFPLMFLSGTFFPRFLMPDWLQHVTTYLPLTPVIDGIRLIATEGKSLVDILPQVGLVGAWAIVIYAIAFRVFRWE
ncbi:MAG TPA: ABC transporter permease [Candidatus Saccharimonadales bacterium]|nr:ABC transporter permease [Candidatus Saccharimonadales bacterium]